jgi:uncharacterized protein (TIGR03435 family)
MIGQLTNHLLQSTLFALAASVLVLAFRKNRARIRYSLWLTASLKFLIPFSMLIALGTQIHWTPAHEIATRAASPDVVQTVEQFSEPFTVTIPASQRQTDRRPLAIAVIWFCGFACVMVMRVRAWRSMRIAIRRSQPVDLGLPIEARLSSGVFEPGIVGLWRPTLLLPDGIIERLTQSELEAVIAHELCHIRRRDNLFSAIHMLIEALFWFHPLVWWIGARLLDERERACDEGVISLGNRPDIYADAILNVCKLYTESPLACVSGVTGADIRRRLEAIMSDRAFEGLSRAKKFLLAGAGMAALAGPVAVGLLIGAANAPVIHAQSSAETTISFDVASVKPLGEVDPRLMTGMRIYPGGRFVAKFFLYPIIAYAYNLPLNRTARLSGISKEVGNRMYDIEATGRISPGISARAGEDQIRMMLRTLLADRFKMEIHKETKEMPVYGLVVAKGGPKLQKAATAEKDCTDEPTLRPPGGASTSTPDPEACHTFNGGQGRGLHGRAVTMADLASFLEGSTDTDRPVLDKTAIRGLFHIETQPWQRQPRVGDPGAKAEDGSELSELPPLSQVLGALGLKMEARTDKVDVYVVGHIEEPSAN